MNKKIKREIIEWTALIIIIGGLYVTGWHTEVLGTLQRGVLATGLIRPDLEDDPVNQMNYDFQLRKLDDSSVDVSDFRGEVLFINLWATWCPPCIAEMPDIHDLYLKKGDQVKFMMISLDEDPLKAQAFINRKSFTFPVFSASYGLPKVLHSNSIPTSYVVDKSGKIRVVRRGLAKYDTDEFNDFLEKLLSE